MSKVRTCSRCGCTDDRACVAKKDDVDRMIEMGSPCHWITTAVQEKQVCNQCSTQAEIDDIRENAW